MLRWIRAFRLLWLVPLVAAAIGVYLVLSTLAARGPEITISFQTAGDIGAGTRVRHRGVELGTVTAVRLADDLRHVDVHVRMQADAVPFLTSNAQFWVARVQLTGGGLSGIDSLTSGAYIEMDPGSKDSARQARFNGLANPPGMRSDQPGTTYTVTAPEVNGLDNGTGVYYRDVLVGEVLASHVAEGKVPVHAEVFVRKPFDARVRTGTVFWRSQGVTTDVTGSGLHVEVTSITAALSGSLSFATPPDAPDYPVAPAGSTFPLFGDQQTAFRASYQRRIPYVTYYESSTAGLEVASKVLLRGIQVGEVTGVQLVGTPGYTPLRVRVALDVLPEIAGLVGSGPTDPATLGRRLVSAGLQAKLDTASYITGAQDVSLEFAPQPGPANPGQEEDAIVLPAVPASGPGGLASASGTIARAAGYPYAALGNTANSTLQALSARLAAAQPGKQLAPIIAKLDATRANIQRMGASLAQTLAGLPATADRLNGVLAKANRAVSDADSRYGAGSDLPGEIAAAVAKYYDLARYARLVADRVNQHPESIIRGSTGLGSER